MTLQDVFCLASKVLGTHSGRGRGRGRIPVARRSPEERKRDKQAADQMLLELDARARAAMLRYYVDGAEPDVIRRELALSVAEWLEIKTKARARYDKIRDYGGLYRCAENRSPGDSRSKPSLWTRWNP